jgi:segregation and condensation protein A
LRAAAPGPDGGDQRRASGRERHTQKITVYLSAEELLDLERARLASLTLTPKPPPKVDTQHIHAPVISIRDQAKIIATLLRELGRASFRRLTANAAGSYEVVASFLALLELYREDMVSFEQVAPLGELYVTWTGTGSMDTDDTDSVNELTESDDDQ